MWPFKTNYSYFKSVNQHYYGLCGVTIKYIKLKDEHSAIKSLTIDLKMSKLGFHSITKEEYEARKD